jgi:hypothetical protein
MSHKVPTAICSTCCNWNKKNEKCNAHITTLHFADECGWRGLKVIGDTICCKQQEIGNFGRAKY